MGTVLFFLNSLSREVRKMRKNRTVPYFISFLWGIGFKGKFCKIESGRGMLLPPPFSPGLSGALDKTFNQTRKAGHLRF
jgi:hypothetical protein